MGDGNCGQVQATVQDITTRFVIRGEIEQLHGEFAEAVQFFRIGPDGIEASELANVRGEKEALHKAMAIEKC